MNDTTPTQRQRRTAKIRVCIALDHEGNWSAIGEKDQDASWHVMAVGDRARLGATFYWAWITLPLPDRPKVREQDGGTMREVAEIGRIHLDGLLKLAKQAGLQEQAESDD